MKLKKYLYLSLIFILAISCQEQNTKNTNQATFKMEKINANNLKGKKVFFAHQSVGGNIIEGIDSLKKQNQELSFIQILTLEEYLKLENKNDSNLFYFIHSKVKENGMPLEKIKNFKLKMAEVGDVDAAFLKFCYADVGPDTDIDTVYKAYLSAIDELSGKYPSVQFVYFTVPVTVKKKSFKSLIKKILGMEERNVNISKINTLFRNSGKTPMFDIAALESGHNPGQPINEIEYLDDSLAADQMGHLNDKGARYIASHLINFLNEKVGNE